MENELKHIALACNEVLREYRPDTYCTIAAVLGYFPHSEPGGIYWDSDYSLRVFERESGDLLLRCGSTRHPAELPDQLREALEEAPEKLWPTPPPPRPAPPPPRRAWIGPGRNQPVAFSYPTEL